MAISYDGDEGQAPEPMAAPPKQIVAQVNIFTDEQTLVFNNVPADSIEVGGTVKSISFISEDNKSWLFVLALNDRIQVVSQLA